MTTVNKLLIGVAVGAILGVLYAPNKGSITRRNLSRTGNDVRDRFNDLKDAINDKIDSFREEEEDARPYEDMVIIEQQTTPRTDSWQS